jgi:hypothetical protein
VLAGVSGFLYSVSFIVLRSDLLSALFLLLGGLFSIPALTALYQRLHEGAGGFAVLALLLAVGAALGAAIHGGYDLANALHPPGSPNTDLPNAVDPRGLLTFGVAGLGLALFAWLLSQQSPVSRSLVYLGYLSAALMIVLYLGRLIVLDATSPAIVIPALLEGFIVNPLWYIWLGIALMRSQSQSRSTMLIRS